MEIEENRIKFLCYQQIFKNIISICNHHNKQSLELDFEYNHPATKSILTDKMNNRHLYLDIYIKTQLCSVKTDMPLYFNSKFNFGYSKFIDIDCLIMNSNDSLRNTF